MILKINLHVNVHENFKDDKRKCKSNVHCTALQFQQLNVTPLTFGTYWFKSSWTCYDRINMPHTQELNYLVKVVNLLTCLINSFV